MLVFGRMNQVAMSERDDLCVLVMGIQRKSFNVYKGPHFRKKYLNKTHKKTCIDQEKDLIKYKVR